MSSIKLFFITAMFCILLSGCEKAKDAEPAMAAPSIDRTLELGPVKMVIRITPPEPRLSGTLEMEVTVNAPEGVDVTPPPFGKEVGEFLVLNYINRPAEPVPGGRQWRFKYELEPTHAGKHLIRSVSIEFADKRPGAESQGETVLLESDPIEINVTSELGDKKPSLTDLQPMKPPMPLPSRSQWIPALTLLLIGATAAFFFLKRKKTEAAAVVIKRTPEEIARDELNALLAANLHGTGQFKDFYVRLTGIVRRYIEGTTGIHAPEQTTEEFLRDMRSKKDVFTFERSQQLAYFLESADMVKYAGMEPSAAQIQDAIARAQEFIGLQSALTPMPQRAEASA